MSVNLTPLIDVVFLLLIFFMVSTTFTKESHLEIDLPKSSSAESAQVDQTIEILINESGEYSVSGKPLVNNQSVTLKRALEEVRGESDQQSLVITADARTPHQSVVTAMDIAGQLGFSKLSITSQMTHQ